MRSSELDLKRYDTDKIASQYLERYDPVLQPLLDRDVKLLELGIHKGGSLQLWRDYFQKGTIVGIDKKLPPGLVSDGRIRVFEGSQGDTAFLSRVAKETAPEGFDVIIDDASHIGSLTRTAFWHLFEHHLKPGGLYVIEDWGTGYWNDWPDGKAFRPRSSLHAAFLKVLTTLRLAADTAHSHNYGMVGLIKELVDEQGAADLTRGGWKGVATRTSKFASMTIEPSLVFVRKRA